MAPAQAPARTRLLDAAQKQGMERWYDHYELRVAKVERAYSGPMGRANRYKVTEILLPNAKVLAVNQKAAVEGNQQASVPSSVSLEVTQHDAQKLRLGESVGRLSLVLRSLGDKETYARGRPVGVDDLSRTSPPSYLPVLQYEGGGLPEIEEYNHSDAAVDTSEADQPVEITERPQATIVPRPEMPAFSDTATIVVVRGVEVSEVGVDRP